MIRLRTGLVPLLLALAGCSTPAPAPPPGPAPAPASAALPKKAPRYTAAALALEEALLAYHGAPSAEGLAALQAQASAAIDADPDYSYLRLLEAHTLALGGQAPPPDRLGPAEQAWFGAYLEPHTHAIPALVHCHRVHACLVDEHREIPPFLLRSGEQRGSAPVICGGMRLDPAMCPDDYSIFERLTLRSRGRDRLEGWTAGDEPFGVADLSALIGLEPGMRMADLGSGVGWLAMPFARQVGPDGKVYGLEIDPYALALLEQLAQQPGLDALEPVESSIVHSNLTPGSVDLVFVCDTLKAILREQLEDPATLQALLTSVATALGPGGRLVVVEKPDAPTMHRVVTMETLERTILGAGFVLVDSPTALQPVRHMMIFEPAQGE